jgi:putative Mg2+ transporter-C (MgtC) family protein
MHFMSIVHLLAALVAGGLIGLERSYQGRPAGFRTHALVCMASSLLMQLTLYQAHIIPDISPEMLRIDPTRMAQGIMTGIGFLGAGVIMKDNVTIRGLTTAASIWMTAAIGILLGVGLYVAAIFCTALTIGALSLFRWLEAIVPGRHYARLELHCSTTQRFSFEELKDIVARHDCGFSSPGFALQQQGATFRYEMTLQTRKRDNFHRLAESLGALNKTNEFRITPASE